MKDKEVRQLTTPIEIRSEGEGQSEFVEGYALKFEKWSERLGYSRRLSAGMHLIQPIFQTLLLFLIISKTFLWREILFQAILGVLTLK